MAREAFLTKESASLDRVSTFREPDQATIAENRPPEPTAERSYLVERNGTLYAGTHVLVDLWGASNLDDIEFIERALRDCVDASGATLLHLHLHEFTPNGGVSGVAVLAESHISVHTWPEARFAAFDVFMCGSCDPAKTVPVLKRAFSPERVELIEQMRGRQG